MKHEFKYTVELIGWSLFACLAGLLLIPFGNNFKESLPVSPWVAGLIVVISFIVGAVFWMYLINKRFKDRLIFVYSFIMGVITLDFFELFFSIGVWFKVLFSVLLAFGFFMLVRFFQKDWANVRKYYFVMNFWNVFAITGVAVLVGVEFSLFVGLIILFLASIYDFIAVFKTKHMVSMARFFLDARLIPGLFVPKEEVGRFALIGGGDIFFIVFIMASANNLLLSLVLMFNMLFYVSLLFFVSERKKFYPALPFILVGVLQGLLMWFFLTF